MKSLILFSVAFWAFYSALGQECVTDDERIDCYMVEIPSQLGCQAKGCSWCPPSSEEINAPSCYLPETYGYKFEEEPLVTPNGFLVTLRRATNVSYYGHDSQVITVEGEYQSNYRLRIKISDDKPRWEIPLKVNPAQGGNANPMYEVQFSNEPAFSFKIIRKSSRAVIFDTSLGGFTFSDQFLQISTKLPSTNLYGIGENEQMTYKHSFQNRSTWPLFTRDQPPEGNANMYGVQPHYTVVENDGNTHTVVFMNSNAQEFVILPTPGVLYRTIGGILDFYVFLGPTPENTVQQYTEAVGRMEIPPYWALGFHLCKYNYASLENVQAAVNRTAQYGIPHDVQFIDSDLMERELDFTLSQERYSALPAYIQQLHEKGMKFITIIDPGISNGEPNSTYKAFDLGTELDVFIKKQDGTPAQGKVWPVDPVQYPDFTKNSTAEWWMTLFADFKKLIDYDGIWIDMNEPVNFASGDLFEGCEINTLNTPPYVPNIRNKLLYDGTLCPDHVDSLSLHYNTHSMYGYFQAGVTKRAVLAARPGNRSFILSRSTFLGSGKYVAHWLGDNFSKWSNLHTSVIGMLQYNLFGIPLVGADICGFIGNATADLCLRWQQLGAFYPYSRNHNGGHTLQDPGFFGDAVALSTKQALETRYTLLPYLYTLFYYHNTRGDTVARALWHLYPTDPLALAEDRQFLWGDGLMVCPVLEDGVTFLSVLLPPADRWYYYYSGIEFVATGEPPLVRVAAPLNEVVLFVRGGTIIPTQEPGLNTVESSLNPFHLIVPTNYNESAEGRMYFDDGNSLDPLGSGKYFLAKYTYADGLLTTTIENDGYGQMNNLILSSVTFMGISPEKAYNVASIEIIHPHVSTSTARKIFQDPNSNIIQIKEIDIPINSRFTISLQYYCDNSDKSLEC